MKNWEVVHSTQQLYLSEIIKCMLREHDVECVILNNQSTAYNTFGEIKIYVPTHQKQIALSLIQQYNTL